MSKHKHDTPEQREKFEAYMVTCGRSAVITWENDRPVWSSDRCDWHTWLHCCAANETTVAELVGLLREQTAMIERQRDFNDDGDGRMIERAKAAIAKHGGG